MTLIQRLEQAGEGSRELDAEIAEIVGIKHRTHRSSTGHSKGREWLVDTESGGIEIWARSPPAYTTSLDAALTLVPEGWEWNVNGTSAMAFARVANEGLIHEPSFCKHTGPNRAALNLCIVALKAIEDIRARSSDR